MNKIEEELEFYLQKVKETKAKLYNLEEEKKRRYKPKVYEQKITDRYSLYRGDCVEIIKGLLSDSVHFLIYSPPFSSLFTYSNSIHDMGNSKEDQFYIHFDYLIPELYRVLMPGRLMAVHCMDLPTTIQSDGYLGIKDFPGYLREQFTNYGFILHAKIVIWKDPLVQATRTKKLELAHKQISKDSTRCATGYPDYVYVYRKPGINLEPVAHGRGFERYIGEREEPKAKKNNDPAINKYSHFVWQRYASPVWMDIRQTNTLNVLQAREKSDERHVCPLALDVIARCLELWTNKGDIILDPFNGIGSVGFGSLIMDRKYLGIELKKSYYDVAIKNLDKASIKNNKLNLFKGKEENEMEL